MLPGCGDAMEPPFGAAARRYADADLLDSFGVALPDGTERDAFRLARLALSEPPLAFRALLRLRDLIMAPFGVHSSTRMRDGFGDRPHIDFFPVLAVSKSEIEVGLDDRHLDFRAWFTLEDTADGLLLKATTVARAHNLLGRVYLTIVRPFHVMVVRNALYRLLTRLGDPRWLATV